MLFIDTHTHLYSEEFKEDRKAVVEKAIKNGVNHLFLPNVDVDSIQPMIDLVWDFP